MRVKRATTQEQNIKTPGESPLGFISVPKIIKATLFLTKNYLGQLLPDPIFVTLDETDRF